MKVQEIIEAGYTEEEAKRYIRENNDEKPCWYKTHQQILDELGVVPAVVFGRIESFASRGTCYAAQSTIANSLHLNRATVNRAIKKLIKSGYIEDLTPDLANRPHSYEILWSVGF